MILGGSILCLVIGCDRVTRHNVLTFFFEGVPPLDGKTAGADANIVTITNVDKLDIMNTRERGVVIDATGQKRASRHEFVKDCAACHTGGLSSGRQELRQPLPVLCTSCHADLTQEGDFLHGPLNVGECVFCHDAHQSAYVHLQKAPQPQLCYRCHQKQDIAVIPGHSEQLEGICTDCHEPHGSSRPNLLKTTLNPQDEPARAD